VEKLCPQVKEGRKEDGRRSADCTASEMMRKGSIRSSQRFCRHNSLNAQVLRRKDPENLCSPGWQMGTSMMVQARNR